MTGSDGYWGKKYGKERGGKIGEVIQSDEK